MPFAFPPAVAIAIVLATLLFFPLVALLWADLLLTFPRAEWEISGILVDPSDLLLIGLAVGLLLKRQQWQRVRIPGLGLWLLLAGLTCLSYLAAPYNQEYLTDPIRVGYQLIRYAIKPLLFYPLVFLLLRTRLRLETTLFVIVLVGDLFAALQTWLGYTTYTRGLGNLVAGLLIGPTAAALWGLVSRTRPAQRLFYLGSLLLILRALLFAGSRGGWAGTLATIAVFALGLAAFGAGRQRLVRWTLVAMAAIPLLFLVKPDLLDRPMVKRLLTLRNASSIDTFQWRVERWQHFSAMIEERPLLGHWNFADESLGDQGNTPHSSYMVLAVAHGLPVTALWVLFASWALLRVAFLLRSRAGPELRLIALSGGAALSGLLVHGLVEQTLKEPFALRVFWFACALPALVVAIDREERRSDSVRTGDEQANETATESAAAARRPTKRHGKRQRAAAARRRARRPARIESETDRKDSHEVRRIRADVGRHRSTRR